jgi:hypothetical protein
MRTLDVGGSGLRRRSRGLERLDGVGVWVTGVLELWALQDRSILWLDNPLNNTYLIYVPCYVSVLYATSLYTWDPYLKCRTFYALFRSDKKSYGHLYRDKLVQILDLLHIAQCSVQQDHHPSLIAR